MGSFKIMQTLCSLPISEHDPFSFTADLISYTVSTMFKYLYMYIYV